MRKYHLFSFLLVCTALLLIIVIGLEPSVGAALSPEEQDQPREIASKEGGAALFCDGPVVAFDSGLPAGWIANMKGLVYWTSTDDVDGCGVAYDVGGTPPGFCANSEPPHGSDFPFETNLFTNPFELTAATEAMVQLRMRHKHEYTSVFDIAASTDLGTTWTLVFSDTVGNSAGGELIDLWIDDYAGSPEVMLRFRYQAGYYDHYVQIDEVKLVCLAPNIEVNPLSLASAQLTGTQVTRQMLINNSGELPLSWEISEAVTGDCQDPADMPWLNVNPETGTTPYNGSTPVDITFDSTGLSPDHYQGKLCVTSNDPDQGPGQETDLVEIAVALYVEAAPPPDIDVSPLSLSKSLMPDSVVIETIAIENAGGGTLEWQIEESSGLECDTPSDIPWLALTPMTGSTDSANQTWIEVTINSYDQAPGTYLGAACIISNDPDAGPGNGTGLVAVAVELEVAKLRTFLPFIMRSSTSKDQ